MTPEEKFAEAEKFATRYWPDRLAYMTFHKSKGGTQSYEVRLDHVEKWRADIHFVHRHWDGSFTVDADE